MESHLGVKQSGVATWRGIENPDGDKEVRGSNKTIFEMVDIESVGSLASSLADLIRTDAGPFDDNRAINQYFSRCSHAFEPTLQLQTN